MTSKTLAGIRDALAAQRRRLQTIETLAGTLENASRTGRAERLQSLVDACNDQISDAQGMRAIVRELIAADRLESEVHAEARRRCPGAAADWPDNGTRIDGRPDDPMNGQCVVDEVPIKYASARERGGRPSFLDRPLGAARSLLDPRERASPG